jgi:hypothetical protein
MLELVDVDGRPYLSASTTLVQLLLNISYNLYTLQCGKQFCPYLAANCRWISAAFIPSDTNKCTTACCLSLVQTSSGAVIFTSCSLSTNGLQVNHNHSMSPSDLELQHDQTSAEIVNHTMKILQYRPYLLYPLCIYWTAYAVAFLCISFSILT